MGGSAPLGCCVFVPTSPRPIPVPPLEMGHETEAAWGAGSSSVPLLSHQQSTLRRSPSSESFLGSESSYVSSMSTAPSRDGSDLQAEVSGDGGGDKRKRPFPWGPVVPAGQLRGCQPPPLTSLPPPGAGGALAATT